jgi:hypothetical protein
VHPDESPFEIVFVSYITGWRFEQVLGPGSFTDDTKRSIADARDTIQITGATNVWAGTYEVRPRLDENGKPLLLCGNLDDSERPGATPVHDFAFRFVLGRDCNGDGIPDQPDGNGNWPCTFTCGPDCIYADFNQDGGVDGADIEAFFAVWQTGSPDADVNGDGGVDGSDVERFFCYWETGGCVP